MLPSFVDAFSGEEHEPIVLDGGATGALLIHGYPGTPAEMRPLAEQLHQRGWRVRAPLLPGFGKEIDTLADRTHIEWHNAVQSEYEALQRETERTVIIGYSMGGALAILSAAQTSPTALVLLAPFWEVDHILWKALPFLRTVLPKVKPFRLFKPDFDDPKMREGVAQFAPDADLDDPKIREAIRDFELPVSMFNQIRLLGKAGYDTAPKIDCPALILQGTEDDIVRPHKTHGLINRFSKTPTYIEVDATHQLLDTDEPAWARVKTQIIEFTSQFEETPVTP